MAGSAPRLFGFVGLGRMGKPMAQNILKAGIPLNFYARDPEKAKQGLEGAEKSSFFRTASALAAESNVIVSMVLDDKALDDVLFGKDGAAETLREGSVVVSMSFNSPDFIAKTHDRLAAKKITFLNAPVFGRPEVADAAKLLVCAAGNPAAIEECMPVFSAVGRKTLIVGDHPRNGALIKSLGNFLVAMLIEGLSEATVLSRKVGIEPPIFQQLVENLLVGGLPLASYAKKISEGTFDQNVGATVGVGLKDVGVMRALAVETNTPLPLADLHHQHLRALKATGRGEYDWCAVAEVLADLAGVSLRSSSPTAPAAAAAAAPSSK